jgi:hypothetical protein
MQASTSDRTFHTAPLPCTHYRHSSHIVVGSSSCRPRCTSTSNRRHASQRRLVFVASLPAMQLVDGALKDQQCTDLLKAAVHDFKLDNYLTREQMQERMRMRPVQRRRQQSGIVVTYRGVQLWQLAATEGAARLRCEQDLEQGGGCHGLRPWLG